MSFYAEVYKHFHQKSSCIVTAFWTHMGKSKFRGRQQAVHKPHDLFISWINQMSRSQNSGSVWISDTSLSVKAQIRLHPECACKVFFVTEWPAAAVACGSFMYKYTRLESQNVNERGKHPLMLSHIISHLVVWRHLVWSAISFMLPTVLLDFKQSQLTDAAVTVCGQFVIDWKMRNGVERFWVSG